MSRQTWRLWVLLSCVGLFAGCAGVGPVAAQSRKASASEDEYEGWLFKSLTRPRDTSQAATANSTASSGSSPGATSGVIPTSATQAATAPTSATLIPTTIEPTIAGPPPTLPPDLPGPSSGAVSIDEAKAKAEKEKKKGFELSDLAPENIGKNLKNAAGYGPNEKIARETMKEGEALFEGKQYKEAAAKFATAADRWPDTPLEEKALFLKGESEFFGDAYPKAHDTYGGLLKKYTNTRFLDTVIKHEFAIGQYWDRLQTEKPLWTVAPNVTDRGRPTFDTFGYAIQAYERVRLNDPTGPRADDAVMATANAYFRRGQFEEAAYHYDVLIKEYPNSELQTKAHLLGLQAKMRIYQGTFYGGAPLDDAKKIADQTLRQYGDRLGDERPRVAKALAQIIEEKANRDFELGQYYERLSDYGAARLYYKSLIEEYPGTEKAKQAQERMVAIRDKADKPPKPFEWLTKPLGSKK